MTLPPNKAAAIIRALVNKRMNVVQSISERRLAYWVEDGSKMFPLTAMKPGFIP